MYNETAPTRSDAAVESETDEPSTSGDPPKPCELSSELAATAPVVDDEPPPDRVLPDESDPDDDDDAEIEDERSEPLAYRLERLRLWRTVVTLAIVVVRLIRSF